MALRLASLLAIAAGAGLLALAVVTGQAEVGLLVVVPFIIGSGPLPLAGTLLVAAGIVGLFVATARHAAPRPPPGSPTGAEPGEGQRRTEAGGVIMIGPIPIVLGTDRRTAILAALGGVLALLGVVVALILWG